MSEFMIKPGRVQSIFRLVAMKYLVIDWCRLKTKESTLFYRNVIICSRVQYLNDHYHPGTIKFIHI